MISHASSEANATTLSIPSARLLFFGNRVYGTGRRLCYQQVKQALAARGLTPLRSVYRVWDAASFETSITGRYLVAINMHKDCGNAHSPVEAFRIAQLVNARILVLSERSHTKDEVEFAGVVRFFDNASAIVDAYERLVSIGDAATIAKKSALDAARCFQRRFRPGAIFARAGMY